MKNQFFYSRTEKTPGTEGDEVIVKTYRDSINVDKIIRSVDFGEYIIVLLDDIHERTTEVPIINTKSNKMTGTKKQTAVYQTEVYLYGEDIERFKQFTEIN